MVKNCFIVRIPDQWEKSACRLPLCTVHVFSRSSVVFLTLQRRYPTPAHERRNAKLNVKKCTGILMLPFHGTQKAQTKSSMCADISTTDKGSNRF